MADLGVRSSQAFDWLITLIDNSLNNSLASATDSLLESVIDKINILCLPAQILLTFHLNECNKFRFGLAQIQNYNHQ